MVGTVFNRVCSWSLVTRCWLQGDNACKEVRNSYTGRWACLMCQGSYFQTVSHHHLEVGHTHEDIGPGS